MNLIFSFLVLASASLIKGNVIGAGESDIGERIWNGQTAAAGQFPHQALLIMTLNDGNQSACGGSLIKPNTVLTAAHCCQGVATTRVYLGLILVAERNQSYVQQFDVPASDQIIHENYDNSTISNDICLLKLPNAAQLNANVSTIALPKTQDNNPSQYNNQYGVVSGFGQTNSFTGLNNQLLSARVRMVTHSTCSNAYSFINKVSDSQLCTSKISPWAGPCHGDSGGALFVNGTDGKPMEIGIVSWGVGLCGGFLPVVYTYVPAYVDWINSKGV